MLKDILEIFESEYNKKGDSLILDEYVLDDGRYILVDIDADFKIVFNGDIKYDKKSKSYDQDSELIKKLKFYNYNSKLISMNKPIDPNKAIHSNNYLSFFVKREKFNDTNDGKQLTDKKINDYYDILANPMKKYSGKKKAIELYESYEDENGKVDEEKVENIRKWVLANIYDLGKAYTGKKYVKVFFKASDEEFTREGNRYKTPNIYNVTDYNTRVGDKLYGLPGNNMGLNDKKEYLKQKTRKSVAPNLLDSKDVLMQEKLFDYLVTFPMKKYYHVYVSESKGFEYKESGELPSTGFTGYYLNVAKGKSGADIKFVDNFIGFRDKINGELKYKEVVENKFEKGQDYGTYCDKKNLLSLIDEVYFSKYLKNNMTGDVADITGIDSDLKYMLSSYKDGIYNWIYKDVKLGIPDMIDRMSTIAMRNAAKNSYFGLMKKQFNLRCAFINYFNGGKHMADIVNEMKNEFFNKVIARETQSIASDEEYAFAVGQLVHYLLSLSKAQKKPFDQINMYTCAKKDKIIKENIRKLYRKYNYDSEAIGFRVNNMYAMILSYEPSKIDADMMLAGFLHSSVVYISNKNDN